MAGNKTAIPKAWHVISLCFNDIFECGMHAWPKDSVAAGAVGVSVIFSLGFVSVTPPTILAVLWGDSCPKE